MTEQEIAKKIELEIHSLPFDTNKRSNIPFDGVGIGAIAGLSFVDIANMSIQLVSMISGVIIIADWTYKYWKNKRQQTLQRVQDKVASVGKSCSAEQAEMIIKMVCEMSGREYPPK